MRCSLILSSVVALATCGTPTPAPDASAPSLVPSDYRSRFVEVRNCRATIEHLSAASTGAVTNAIRVLINPEASRLYLANAIQLPAGTLVIKEEFDDDRCAHLTGWTVMRKEPGFDDPHGDWHWQRVRASDGRALEDGRVSRCFNCHNRPACTRRDWQCTDP